MLCEVIGCGKGSSTSGTFKPLSHTGLLMSLQRVFPRKAFSTYTTLELGSLVFGLNMAGEIISPGEFISTLLTNMGLTAMLDPLMSHEVLLLGK